MADLTDLNWWLRGQRGGVASGGSTLPPAMPGAQPKIPPPTTSPFSDVMGSPAFQLGYPLIAGLVSGAFPNRGGRAIAGLSAGLNTANYFNQLQRQEQEQAKQQQEKDVLGTKLGDYLNATKFTGAPKIDTAQPLAEPANAETAFSNIAAPTNVAPVIPDSPRKGLAQALLAAGQPAAALKFMESEKDTPINVGPGHTILDPSTYEPRYTAPPARSTATPPRPVYSTQGGEAVSSVYNPETQTWEEKRQPLTPAPRQEPAPLHPLQEANLKSQISSRGSEDALRNARIKRLNDLTNTVNNPKATAGQLSSAYNALIRDRDSIDTPDEDKPVLNEAIRGIRARLADLGKTPGGGGPGAPAPAAAAQPPGKPIGKTKDGKLVYETPDGRRVVQE